jgi:predicted small integral membrane protein
LFHSLSTVTLGAIYAGLGAVGLIVILAVFVGETLPSKGFLPWTTTWGDRFFVSLLIFFLLALLWMKFIEPFLPIYGVLVVGFAIGVVVVKWG